MKIAGQRSRIWIGGLVALLVAALAGVAYWQSGRQNAVLEKDGRRAFEIPSVAASSAPVGNVSAMLAAMPTNQTPTVRGTKPYVLTSAKPFQKSLRLAAESLGARTVSVLSRNALLVEATPEVRRRLASDGRFDEIAEFLPSSKVQQELVSLIMGGAESVEVALLSLSAEDRERVIACLKQGGGEMLQGCLNEGDIIHARLPADLVVTLSGRGDVRWMEHFVRPQMSNDQAVQPEAMDVINVWNTSRGLGLTGLGQKITTSDSGIDTGSTNTMHRDLRNRVKGIYIVEGCDAVDSNGHGTHTAGSIIGDGTCSDGKYRGTAYEAELYAWFCGANGGQGIYTPDKAEDLFCPSNVAAYIHSASWGSDVGGQYTALCIAYDNYVWDHPEFLPVFAAGNEGPSRYTLDSPGSAKNVLTVGATGNRPKNDPATTASFSSRGPCQDGRTKPDVAAPGHAVTSTRSCMDGGSVSNSYTTMSGTSMATPLTAGSVALVRQWLVEKRGFADEDGKRPTAALMKAVIMGGAKGSETPNNDQGWGRVDLANTLAPTNGCAVMLIDRIPFDEGFVTNIVIETTNAAPLDVQLVWVDYPGSTIGGQSSAKLINDLDLTVSSRVPGEPTTRHGNGGSEPDTLNNAESVRIAMAMPNKYVITVDCRHILYSYLDEEGKPRGAAALYVRGAFDPAAEVEEPAYVHLKKLDKNFMSLDSALKAIRDEDETVEILDWVGLDCPVTLTGDCTICATNENAAASYVARQAGAMLTVTNATVTLSNVVFGASTEPIAMVETNGCLRIGDKVDLGVDVYHRAIATATASGLDLAGALTRSILIHCDAAVALGQAFGTYSCDPALAEMCAARFVCEDDIDRETRGGVGPNGKLVWQTVPVPADEAFGYFVDTSGHTNTFARGEKAVPEFHAAYEHGTASDFVVRMSGNFAQPFNVDKPLLFRGEGEPRPVLTVANAAGFLVGDGGSLMVSNLVFSGYEATGSGENEGFIAVEGGALTLEDGAMLDCITGMVEGGSGVVDLDAGTMTMKPGSAIVNCRAEGAEGTGNGGAIYVDGAGCTLNLQGGVISNCYATSRGGGIFAAGMGNDAGINISGRLTVVDNTSDNYPTADNLYMLSTNAIAGLKLVGELEGCVGIRYSATCGTGNAEGGAFMANAVGAVSGATLESLFNDADATLMGAIGEDDMLVWTKRTADDGQCPESNASAHVYYPDGTVNHYTNLTTAIAFMTNGTTARIELYRGNKKLSRTDAFRTQIALPVNCDLTLAAGEAGYRVRRYRSAGIVVPAHASLVVTNLLVMQADTNPAIVTNAFFDVAGGELTLGAGVCISNLVGSAARDAAAVSVHDGGVLTVLDGAEITHCRNAYIGIADTDYKRSEWGVGGGVLLDHATAALRGCVIRNCFASFGGGGVFACNDSTIYADGDVRIVDNASFDVAYNEVADNLELADTSTVNLTGELTGSVFETPKRATPDDLSETNIAAHVATSWVWDVDSLTNSAAKFTHDVTGDRGVAVSNGVETLVVWSAALHNGVYTNASGKGYSQVRHPVAWYTVSTNKPTALAFSSVACPGATMVFAITNLVKGAEYSLFRTNSLEGGFAIEGVEPFTNFTAEADGACELSFPLDAPPVFWRAVGREIVTTNYFNKGE